MKKKTYSEKLKDPRWQKVRLKVFERDSFACTICRDTQATLHVHHKAYTKNTDPWDYELDNFLTLCEHCHGEVELVKNQIDVNDLEAVKYFYTDGSGHFSCMRSKEKIFMSLYNSTGNLICGLALSIESQKTINEFLKKSIQHGETIL